MKTFYKLNRQKIKFAFVASSLTIIGFVSLVLTIAYFQHSLPDKELMFIILFISSVGFPLIIISSLYFKWQLRQNARQKAFSTKPFDKLENIDFKDSLLHNNDKWHFTEQVKTAIKDGYALTIDISNESSKTVEIIIPVEWKKLDKENYRRLTEKFMPHNIELSIGCLKKTYKLNKQNSVDLNADLNNFIQLLKDNEFEPKKGCA